jgi:hypothetical protein
MTVVGMNVVNRVRMTAVTVVMRMGMSGHIGTILPARRRARSHFQRLLGSMTLRLW